MFYLTLCILLSFSSNADSQSVPYDCRSNAIVPKKDFRLEGFIGRWYIYEHTTNPLEVGVKCTYANVDMLDNGDTIMTTYRTNITTGMEYVASNKISIAEPGVYELFRPGKSGGVKIMVLDTDYSNYIVEYVCTDHFGLSNLTEIIWITTREPFFSEDVINLAHFVVTANGLSLRNVKKMDKNNCAIYA